MIRRAVPSGGRLRQRVSNCDKTSTSKGPRPTALLQHQPFVSLSQALSDFSCFSHTAVQYRISLVNLPLLRPWHETFHETAGDPSAASAAASSSSSCAAAALHSRLNGVLPPPRPWHIVVTASLMDSFCGTPKDAWGPVSRGWLTHCFRSQRSSK
jgi:hypothetical protein